MKSIQTDKILKTWSKEYKKGFFGYFILLFLKERSMYGFEIKKRLNEIFQAKITFQDSAIYQILKKLEKNGMVSSHWEKSNLGPKRKYYTIEVAGEDLSKVFTRDYVLPILTTASRLVQGYFPDFFKQEAAQ